MGGPYPNMTGVFRRRGEYERHILLTSHKKRERTRHHYLLPEVYNTTSNKESWPHHKMNIEPEVNQDLDDQLKEIERTEDTFVLEMQSASLYDKHLWNNGLSRTWEFQY